jgi:hypothetical protein
MTITPSKPSSSLDSDNSQDPTNTREVTMNDPQTHGPARGNPVGDGVNQNRPGDGESFVSKTLLGYAGPQVAETRSPIRLSCLVGDSPSYGASTISILQNKCYYGLEHEDPHDHIQTFLKCFRSSPTKWSD